MRLKINLLVALFLIITGIAPAQNWVTITSDNPVAAGTTLLASDGASSVVEFTLGGFNLIPVNTPRGEAFVVDVKGGTTLLEKGAPDLPKLTASVIIPDNALMDVRVISSQYIDYPFIDIAPSKGNFTRDIDPATVPYTYGRVYEQDAFYPQLQAELREPYILRDYRGQTIIANPFSYNPVTRTLRVYYRMTVEIRQTGISSVNTLNRSAQPDKLVDEFARIYEKQFLNANTTSRYTPLEEQGNMLIISYGAFMDEMQDFVEWKKTIGIPVEMVNVSEIGATATAIKAFVANYYAEKGLTYLLLVGDHAQIPTVTGGNLGGPSDHAYGYLVGNDRYPDIFVGRFSAENTTHVKTQVTRSIAYEKNPDVSVDWFSTGFGIASSEGPGHNGEYDWQHQRQIRTKLMDYTYTAVGEFYEGSRGGEDLPGNPTSAMVTQAVNEGRGIINYTGHGSQTSWVTTGFSNSGVNGLSNNNMWPFIWSVACVNGDFLNSTCFAEAWLRASNDNGPTGAVATLMSTINQSWNPPMEGQDEMVNILVESYENNIKRSFGGLSMNGCMKMNDVFGSAGADMTDTWLIFGDPSLMVRTAMPQNLNPIHEPVAFIGSEQFTVTCSVEGALACLTLNGEILGTATVTGGVAIIDIPTLSDVGEMTLAVTAFNHMPYIAEIEILPLEGPYVVYGSQLINDEAGNNNQQLDYNESVLLTLGMKNVGTESIENVIVSIACTDPYISLADTLAEYPVIPAGEIVMIDNGFGFSVSPDVPDGYAIPFSYRAVSGDKHWKGNFNIIAHSVKLNFAGKAIVDSEGNNNGKADAGETFNLNLSVINAGTAPAPGVFGVLSTNDPFIIIHSDTLDYGTIQGYDTGTSGFTVTAKPDTPAGHSVEFTFDMQCEDGFLNTTTVTIVVGQIPVLIIDLDGNHNSGPVIRQTLSNISVTADYTITWPLTISAYQSVFVCLGTYPSNQVLSNAQGQVLANFMNNGGRVYMEGGDTWAYNTATPAHAMFKIKGDSDGSSDLKTLEGLEETPVEGMSFVYNGDNSYIDRLLPLEDAMPLFRNSMPQYFAAIANDGGIYKTIGSSFEFGGLKDGEAASVKDSLMTAYINYFGLNSSAPLLANFIASKTRICELDEVTFTDFSAGSVISWEWSFPGGVPETSDEQNPVVMYREPGTYDVTLTVSDGTTTFTATKQGYITVDYCMQVSKPEQRQMIKVFPNPGSGYFNISLEGFSGDVTLKVHTLAGSEIISRTQPFTGYTGLDLSALPNGIYILTAETKEARQHVKLIVNH